MLPGLYIGLISGTSMDAVDAALAEVAADGGFRVLGARTMALPAVLQQRLRALAIPAAPAPGAPDAIDELGALDGEVGELFAGAALGLLTAQAWRPTRCAPSAATARRCATARARPGPSPCRSATPTSSRRAPARPWWRTFAGATWRSADRAHRWCPPSTTRCSRTRASGARC
jgi:1,6-anhydro-N-acetylmuramate kinase